MRCINYRNWRCQDYNHLATAFFSGLICIHSDGVEFHGQMVVVNQPDWDILAMGIAWDMTWCTYQQFDVDLAQKWAAMGSQFTVSMSLCVFCVSPKKMNTWESNGKYLAKKNVPWIPCYTWLVVEPPTPLKNDGVSSSVGMMKFPTEWKVIKIHGSQPPTSDY